MAAIYGTFGSCVLFKEIHSDDLGHVWRASQVTGSTDHRTIWLRIFDGEHLPTSNIIEACDSVRARTRGTHSANVGSDPILLDDGGVPALGVDYEAGQPLNLVLERARAEAFPVAPDNALLVVEKIASGVSSWSVSGSTATHGFLHPGLIYLSNDGEVSVTGFGIGRALLDALETPGAVVDARPYLAPEILNQETPTARSDVYSLGAILYHLLTGVALPEDPGDRPAALAAASLSYDGEPLAPEFVSLLTQTLAPSPEDRIRTTSELASDLAGLLYGGAYSPTTFNLALFMDRLFRDEIEADVVHRAAELEVDVASIIAPAAVAPTEAVAPAPEPSDRRWLWVAIGSIIIIAAVFGMYFWTKEAAQPVASEPLVLTPTAAEIEARRRAQEERLKTLTQEMVQQMMAEREQEIRAELTSRQQRIEELQRQLRESERRSAQNRATSAADRSNQEALIREIQAEEEAQRRQEEELEAEQKKGLDGVAEPAVKQTVAAAAAAAASGGEEPTLSIPDPDIAVPTIESEEVSTAASAARTSAGQSETRAVVPGAFVALDDVDTRPVVLKSPPLTWPRHALRSTLKGMVVVQVTVNATGGVDEAAILRADHTELGIPEAALEAAKGFRFKPGMKDGVAITTHAFITWRYDFTEN
jgi:TonB family protein